MSHIPGAPFTGFSLDPKEAEPAVTLRISLTSVQIESLGNGGLHLGHSTGRVEIDITSDSVTAMHDEGTVVHALLRGCDEIEMMRSSRPCRVDVCIWMKDRFQILPLTGVSVFTYQQYPTFLIRTITYTPASPQLALSACNVQAPNFRVHCSLQRFQVAIQPVKNVNLPLALPRILLALLVGYGKVGCCYLWMAIPGMVHLLRNYRIDGIILFRRISFRQGCEAPRLHHGFEGLNLWENGGCRYRKQSHRLDQNQQTQGLASL